MAGSARRAGSPCGRARCPPRPWRPSPATGRRAALAGANATVRQGCDAEQRVRCLASLIAVAALTGCGSTAPAGLPAPARPPTSPPLTTAPAGEVENGQQVVEDTLVDAGRTYTIDRDTDKLELVAGAMTGSAHTCREPVALAMADRGARIAVLCGRERVLDVYDSATLKRLGRTGAGIGPTDLATDGSRLLYVTDALGQSLLVYRLRPFKL